MNTALELKNISKSFQEKPGETLVALKNISLEIRLGEFFIFLGPSGAGKSTLLRVMSGLEKSYEGNLSLSGEIAKSDFSFVFQQFALLPWLTVRENIGLGLMSRNLSSADRNKRVSEELKLFKLEKFSQAFPRELSGGMRQRVGLARALCTNPKIIFMDEPFSELDSFTAEELRQDLLKIWNERKMTIVMVSHNIEEALELADRIAVLTPLPGRIEKIIENSLPRPRNKRSPDFYRLYDELYTLIKP
ncbi:MAG: ABC transporter ATP-binding protein [Parcubacteria group bacterium]|nr:ABC transporter ATP-binding protein [Parcubacteria group bacterium]